MVLEGARRLAQEINSEREVIIKWSPILSLIKSEDTLRQIEVILSCPLFLSVVPRIRESTTNTVL